MTLRLRPVLDMSGSALQTQQARVLQPHPAPQQQAATIVMRLKRQNIYLKTIQICDMKYCADRVALIGKVDGTLLDWCLNQLLLRADLCNPLTSHIHSFVALNEHWDLSNEGARTNRQHNISEPLTLKKIECDNCDP